jgi:putative ABC transport system permease protein
VLFAYGIIYSLQEFSPGNLPRLTEVSLDTTALLFTSAITLLTGFLFGLAPAYQFSTPDLNHSLKAGKQSAASGKRRLRDAFVIVQLAFALVLLTGAGLLVKSFWRLSQVPQGFEPNNLLVVRLALDDEYRADQRQVNYFRELTQRLKALPGVTAAGAATVTPLNSYGIDFDVPWYRAGEPEPQKANAAKARFRSATPDYLQTLGVPLLRGRWFGERDEQTAPRIVLVNQTLAERAWPGQDPIGQRLRFFWADWQSYEVVGVVGNTKSYGLAEDWRAELFVPHAQIPYTVMNVVVRTTSEPTQLAAATRRVLQELDASQPPHSIVTMDELFATALARERFALVLLQALAGLALLLAVIGLYGVLAYMTAQRTHEIGIRTALGATPSDVLKLILGQGLKLTLGGVGVGLVCASVLTRALQSLLFGVSATDPLTFAAVAVLLVMAALLACWLPAWRAAHVDPLLALRQE